MRLALCFLLLVWAGVSISAADSHEVIEQLLSAVRESKHEFIRNGTAHSGPDAAQHMRRKYDHYKKQIETPEQFIEKCASKSELSGKPYQVKLSGGKTVPAREWMLERLAELRKTP